ncbi:hypothetical protein OEZ85_008875 [Tetradesmus obliquus]|uniref:Cytoplasmic dynein 2 light intermediate chain 1 n=1 Tax=Tetradesmus obliquus TaxID=3088 RepID=A0ABY8TK26_TETOB|nr:hypothetical protein OEZ85_008875 [Tetradesmus obliquus]
MSSSTGGPTGIYTPGSIWAKAIEQSKQQKKADSSKDDAYVYILGAKGSGKSTVLNRFLYPTQVEVPKPSQCLEYTFARKPGSSFGPGDRKELAHIWEVSGSDAFAQQLAQGSQIFLTYRQVTTAVVVIVLDLSQPSSVIPTALQCLDLVQRKLAATYTLFERKGLQLPEQLRVRQRTKLLSQHEDKDLVALSGISIVLAGTKWDGFRDSVEAEGQRVLGRCLRWIAHAHGAHLLYLGGLQAAGGQGMGGAAGAAAGAQQQLQPQQLLDNFCRLLSHVTFVGMDRKMPLKLQPQFDHLGPLMIPAGSDKFSSIGSPQVQLTPGALKAAADVAAVQQQWVAVVHGLFPPGPGKAQEQQGKVPPQLDARYREEDVDTARARREAALEAYRREMEAIHRQETAARKQKAAAAAAGGAGQGQQQQQAVARRAR